ncbi:MAG: hypothetical protein WCO56_08135 [Verrucomicrobiota bacterium]
MLGTHALGEVVLLHYVGYGYHYRGIPFWLVSGLNRAQNNGQRLVVFFHELWSVGPPWSSVFWLRWLQWWLVQNLSHRADRCLTSTRRMALWLKLDAPVMTIPSSVVTTVRGAGIKVRSHPPWSVMVFGLTHTRLRTIQAHANFLRDLNQRGALLRILVVGHAARGGADPSDDIRFLAQLVSQDKICIRASVEENEVIGAFQEASFYLTFYPPTLAGKSSSFTTSLACGCPAVFHQGGDARPLTAGKEFMVCDGSPLAVARFMEEASQGKLAAVGAAGQAWYREYADWPVLVNRYAQILNPLLRSG